MPEHMAGDAERSDGPVVAVVSEEFFGCVMVVFDAFSVAAVFAWCGVKVVFADFELVEVSD